MKLRILTFAAVLMLSAAAPRAAAAQEVAAVPPEAAPARPASLEAVKALYGAASYEEALEMLSKLEAAPAHTVYRVLCLIALDRGAEAEKGIQEILALDPLFSPNSDEASPRVQEMFDRVRAAMAPELARTLYADAKAAFDRKEREVALQKFELLLKVIERTGTAGHTLLGELKLLASGYADLARAAAPPAAPAAPSTSANAANGSSTGSNGGSPSNGSGAPGGAAPIAVTLPVPITETFPTWEPIGTVGRGMVFTGTIRVRISAEGVVEGAEIVEPIHPTYDRKLVEAASKWRYQPARRAGVAVGSERTVAVTLKR